MSKFGIGQPVQRKEDVRLLTGAGQYVDDRTLPDAVHAVMLRSPHANARILSIDTEAARAVPGVLAVYTGADVAADGLGGVPADFTPPDSNGKKTAVVIPPYPLLVQDRVRFVGDSVAMVVAETVDGAAEAAEQIVVDYEPLPAVADTASATAPDAPRIWDEAPRNVCYEWEAGDGAAVDAAFAKAAKVTSLDVVNNRVVVAAMETRSAFGAYDPKTGRYTLYIGTQFPHTVKERLADSILKVPSESVHVVVSDVGGGFGAKNGVYREYGLVLWAAKKLGRPVKWVGERADAFLTDYHGRDNVTRAEVAMDADGNFLAMRFTTTAAIGAYLGNKGALSPVLNTPALVGIYKTPAVCVRVTAVFTNTTPTDVYRGAGRPEAFYALERLVDTAARETGIPRDELRIRNSIPPEAMPYKTPLGLTYDSGAYAQIIRDGLATADWQGFEARRKKASDLGRLRGIGFSSIVERCGHGVDDTAQIMLDGDGKATVLMGTMSNGQGHETAYAQVIADRLGLDIADITVIQGDTDIVKTGKGTGGSRSIPLGSASISMASEKIIEKARRIAAHVLEAAEADIAFKDGTFEIVGTDRSITIAAVARAAADPASLPEGMEAGLDESATFSPTNHTYPNGCHVCEVEVDRDTGAVDIVNYVIVHDVGKVLNPLLMEGQLHGGVAQGLGQAAFEHVAYDGDGQMLSGTFMDYCLPHADDLPSFVFETRETPAPSNPLGIKGCGEAGAAAAPPAFVNAVVDALSPLGVRHIDMPVTSEVVWRVMAEADGHRTSA
ncbi:MAG: carbon monoxide dehydrogenase [Rhodospirillaceae bacterium]|nr:carbon monoxide dehydrogenase [Rhodospirillaceae bacterium]